MSYLRTIILLLFSSLAVEAQEAQRLLESLALPVGPSSQKVLKVQMDAARNYLKNPNPNTPSLNRELSDQVRKFESYFALEKNLSECRLGRADEYRQIILAEAANVTPCTINCMDRNYGQNIDALRTMGARARLSILQDEVMDQSLQNAIDNYYRIAKRYSLDTSKIIDRLCALPCTKQAREFLKARLAVLQDQPEPRLAQFDQVREQINAGLTQANYELARLRPQIERGYFSNSPKVNPALNRKYNDTYLQSYISLLSGPDGFLLLTDTMKAKVGDLRTLNDGTQDKTKGKYILPSHTLLTTETGSADIKAAAQNALDLIAAQTQELNRLNSIKLVEEDAYGTGKTQFRAEHYTERDLGRLIKSNPLAVAQVLLKDPQASSEICATLSAVDKRKDSDDRWNKVFMTGGLVSGGALALSLGIGGAAVVGGKFAAEGGTAAVALANVKAMAGLTAATAGVAGAGIGVASLGKSTMDAAELYSQPKEIEQAILSGNSSPQNKVLAQKTLQDYYAARNQAILSGVFTAADLGGLQILKLAKGRAASAVGEYSKTLKTVAELAKTDSRFASTFAKLGSMKGKFVESLSQASLAMRRRVLKFLKTASHEEAQEFASATTRGAQRCFVGAR